MNYINFSKLSILNRRRVSGHLRSYAFREKNPIIRWFLFKYSEYAKRGRDIVFPLSFYRMIVKKNVEYVMRKRYRISKRKKRRIFRCGKHYCIVPRFVKVVRWRKM